MDQRDETSSNSSEIGLTNTVIALLIIFFLFMNVVLAVSISQDWFKGRVQSKPADLLPADYFDVIEPWGETTFISDVDDNGTSLTTFSSSSEIDFSVCTWFTYENLLEIDVNASVQNAITDYQNGFSHLSPDQICIDSDQVVFKRAKRTCDGTGQADCIGVDGLKYSKNSTEIFNYPCTNTFPYCTSTIGSLSFNFGTGGIYNTVSSSTRVMTIDTIFVSPARLAALDAEPKNQFYTREGELFTTSDVYTDLTDDQYYPLISYQGKQRGNFKQIIKLRRYIYAGGYIEDETGPYAEILFRPANLYLDVETNNTTNQIDNFEIDLNSETLNSIEPLYRRLYRVRKMYRESDPTKQLETTCTAYILPTTGNTVSKAYVSIYKRGTDESFSVGETLLILGDDDTSKSLKIRVTSLVDYSIFLIFKSGEGGRKWLLIPELDIGGGKVIPRQDRSSLMRILQQPFDENLYNFAKSRPVSGARRQDGFGDILKTAISGDPLTVFTRGLYSSLDTGFNKSVLPDRKYLNRNILSNPPSGDNDDDIIPDLPSSNILFWWEISQKDVGGILDQRNNKKELGTEIKYSPSGFQNNTTEPYLISLGSAAGNVDPTSSPFYIIEPYLCWKRDKIASRTEFKAMMTMFLTELSSDVQPGNRFLDGNVIWQVVNPNNEIYVYSENYFRQFSDDGGTVTDFVATEVPSTQKYKQPVSGALFQVIFYNYQVDNGSIESGLNADYDNLTVTGGNNNAVVNVKVVNGIIRSVSIVDKGSGYTPAEDLTFTLPTGLIIVNMLADSEDIKYFYVAIPQTGSGVNIFNDPGSNSDIITKNGLQLKSSSISISSNGTLSLTSDPQNSIVSGGGGSGYEIQDVIYIDQIDQNGNTTITGDDRVASSFFSIEITQINKEEGVKTSSLLVDADDVRWNNFFEYNFYEETEDSAIYEKSPQQIGFIDDDDITKFITYGSEQEFKNYLFRSAQGPITSLVGINTLQLKSLNYTLDMGNNNMGNRENLVLGKFIPYASFESENIEKDGLVATNYNNTQFIPYNIQSLYGRVFDESSIPGF